MTRTALAAGTLLFAVQAWAQTQASELLMFDQQGCVHCQRWEREVGTLYDKTDEAKALPLRRVNIKAQKTSGVELASPVRFTPTFVVVDQGREIGRITGYGNDDAFWGLLGMLYAKLPLSQANRS
jgi:thioredoxin-related protein